MRCLGTAGFGLLLLAVPPAMGATVSGTGVPSPDIVAEPLPETCVPIDFSEAHIVHEGADWVLEVSGRSAHRPEDIRLLPVMYVMQPDYWQVMLVGCPERDGATGPVRPYKVRLKVNGSIGHKGIRLLGASPASYKRIDIAP